MHSNIINLEVNLSVWLLRFHSSTAVPISVTYAMEILLFLKKDMGQADVDSIFCRDFHPEKK